MNRGDFSAPSLSGESIPAKSSAAECLREPNHGLTGGRWFPNKHQNSDLVLFGAGQRAELYGAALGEVQSYLISVTCLLVPDPNVRLVPRKKNSRIFSEAVSKHERGDISA